MNKPDNTPENRDLCLCPNCALFTDCNRSQNENFFCGTKPSACPMDASKMCICGGCPVYAANKLAGGYFCLNEIE